MIYSTCNSTIIKPRGVAAMANSGGAHPHYNWYLCEVLRGLIYHHIIGTCTYVWHYINTSIHQATLLLATDVTRLYQPCSRVVASLLQPGYNCCKQQRCMEALSRFQMWLLIFLKNFHNISNKRFFSMWILCTIPFTVFPWLEARVFISYNRF